MDLAIWKPNEAFPLPMDWTKPPALRVLHALVEAAFRAYENEGDEYLEINVPEVNWKFEQYSRNCPLVKPHQSEVCVRSRFTCQFDTEIEDFCDSLSEGELVLLRSFAFRIDGFHSSNSPTSKLVHGISSWFQSRHQAIEKVALLYKGSIRDIVAKALQDLNNNLQDNNDPIKAFVRARVKEFVAKEYSSSIDYFLDVVGQEVAIVSAISSLYF